MQIFYGIVVLLSCIICITLAQGPETPPAIRNECRVFERCNRTDVDVQVCATNGQSCKLFPSECELQRENCNRTLATAWNRTASIQCTNIRFNTTGLCACSSQSLASQCFNQTVTTGICAHGGLGFQVRLCHLFRTECELRRARCNGTDWQTIDSRQCRGFIFNQTNPCMCPKLLGCSRNSTEQCVQVSSRVCSLYANECDVERQRCDGDRLEDVDIQQCRNMQVGRSGDCHCPAVLNCRSNNTNVCVRNAVGICRLMENECSFEQSKCDGSSFIRANPLNCRNFPPNTARNCTCPRLLSCDRNSNSICTLQENQECLLLRNNCELEEANCEGRNLTLINSIHCRNLTVNTAGNCFCPRHLNCTSSATAICVRQQNQQCILLRNNCDLEQARCMGQNLTVTNPLQCHNFPLNASRNCLCANLFNCSRNANSICVRDRNNQCVLLRNNCELEHAKCAGQDPQIVSPLNCLKFEFGQYKNCTCPSLRICSSNSTLSRCIRIQNSCQLLRNDCEVEELKCQGNNITIIPNIQCKLLTMGQNGNCWCPNLLHCQRNSSKVCTESEDGCRLLRNECEFEEMKCDGELPDAKITNMIRCQNIRVGQVEDCACPRLSNCSRINETNICVKGRRGCLRMADACEFEIAKCRGESWTLQHPVQCRSFAVGYSGRCTCPRLNTCSEDNRRNTCYQKRSRCIHLRNECEVEQLRCSNEGFVRTTQNRCRGIRRGTTAACRCPELRRCDRRQTVCANNGQLCKLFENDCEFKRALCLGEKWKIFELEACCELQVNETRQCSFTNESGICARNSNGMCRLFTAQCELNAVNAGSTNRYTITDRNECKCVDAGRSGRCSQEPTCEVPEGSARQICARFRNSLKWFNSRCELRHHNYNTCKNFQVVQARQCTRIYN